MPSQSLRKCTQPGCDALVKSGRCSAHSRKSYHNPKAKQLYNSRRWQVLRVAHLSDNPWCVDCFVDGRYVLATEVDHINPHKGDAGLFFDPANLQSLCKVDHSRKTASEVWND
jgi:5-methylcytosine-specific restriction enzyme A